MHIEAAMVERFHPVQNRVTLITSNIKFQPNNIPMHRKTELIIGYDANQFPIGAVCYGCGAGMPRPDPALTTPKEAIIWFSQAFEVHKEMKHPNPVTAVTVDDADFPLD